LSEDRFSFGAGDKVPACFVDEFSLIISLRGTVASETAVAGVGVEVPVGTKRVL
jgi:hypothetical protein